jgi:hypothetical protein
MGQLGAGLPLAPRFSFSGPPYSRLPANPNPLAGGAKPSVTKADTAGAQQALAKIGSMCRSATGEGNKKYTVREDDSAIGNKAFESLDRFKRAGLNSFQASFFSRMIQAGLSGNQIKAAIDQAGKRYGQKIATELFEGMSKLAAIPGAPLAPSPAPPAATQPPNGATKLQPTPLNSKQLFGTSGPIGKDPSSVASGGGQGFLSNYGDKLNEYYNPASNAWNRDAYGSDAAIKNVARAGMLGGTASGAGAAGLAGASAGAGAGAAVAPTSMLGRATQALTGPGAKTFGLSAAGGVAGTVPMMELMGERAKSKINTAVQEGISQPQSPFGQIISPVMDTVRGLGTAATGANDLISQAQDPNSSFRKSLMDQAEAKIRSMPEFMRATDVLDRAEKLLPANQGVGSGMGSNISNFFQQNANWLIPLLMTSAVGGVGGGALGGTGGALGGAIGLPLIYYLMQNPEMLSSITGSLSAPNAGAKPPVAAPPAAAPPAAAPAPAVTPS